MIQVYPRPDTETNTWARHRWAYYDGVNSVQYKIPIGVSFGAFPYVFSLDSGSIALGMSLGASGWNTSWGTGSNTGFQDAAAAGYGYLIWTPTASVSGHTVTITVTDQQRNTLTITFTVSTSSSTSQFIFIDAVHGSDSTGTGTISAPWQTIGKGMTGNATKLLYLRAGNYTWTSGTTARGGTYLSMNTTTVASAYMGFPGDAAPTIDMTTGCFASDGNGSDLFWQGLSPNGYQTSSTNAKLYWAWNDGSSTNRQTFDAITWTNSGYGSTGTDVATSYYFDGDTSTYSQYQFVNNCSETNRQSGRSGNNYAGFTSYGVDSLLAHGYSIIQSGLQLDSFQYLKVGATNSCIRGNYINTTSSSGFTHHPFSTGQGGSGMPLQTCESCYNTIVSNNGGIYETESGAGFPSSGALWVYRNSVNAPASIGFGNGGLDSTCTAGGPYVFESNACQGANNLTGTNVTNSGNSFASSGLLDGNGRLVSSSSLGILGAQIA